MQEYKFRHKSGALAHVHHFEESEVSDFIRTLQNSQKANTKYAATYVNSKEQEGMAVDPSVYRTYCKIDICNAIYAYKNFFSDYVEVSLREIFKNVLNDFEDYEYLYDIVEDEALEYLEEYGVYGALSESPRLEARVFSETLDLFNDYLIRKIGQLKHYKDAVIIVNKNRIEADIKVKRIPALVADSSEVEIDFLVKESIVNFYDITRSYRRLHESETRLELQSLHGHVLSEYAEKALIQEDTTFKDSDFLAIFEVGAESEYIRDLPYDWFRWYERRNQKIHPRIVFPKIKMRALNVYVISIYDLERYFNVHPRLTWI